MEPVEQVLLGMICMTLWEARDRHFENKYARWFLFVAGVLLMGHGLYRFGLEQFNG